MDEKYHFIGVGGIGMSSLACILMQRKAKVSGSDLTSSYITDGLKNRGADIFIGHDASHVKEDKTVVYTTGVGQENCEFMEACRIRTKMLHRSDLLHSLMQGYKMLAIAGSHGKTTTSALLTEVLIEANLDPSFSIGGILKSMNANGKHGEGEYFVAESDESDGTFLKYKPFGAILTNISTDHMDYFLTKDRLKDAFRKFLIKVQSQKHLFWCKESKYLREIHPSGYGYGFSEDCELRAKNFKQDGWRFRMDISFKGQLYLDVECALIGHHNALNALAVFGMGISLGIKEEAIRKALFNFQGVKRRADILGDKNSRPLFIDDYAHHPNEVANTLAGLRLALNERRLITVFEPHRYSRVKDCQGLFAGMLDASDLGIVTDIYPAGEKAIESVSSKLIIEELENCETPVSYSPINELEKTLLDLIEPNDAIVFMGAGSLSTFARDFAKKWQMAEASKKEVLL